MKMLVVDDSRAMRTFLSFLGETLSFAVTAAEDGREALERLVKNDPRDPFAVALVDWDMPRMNGVEFVEAVRRNREFDRVKLMMVTTQNSQDRVRQALQAGADEFLMKPVTAEILEQKLQLLGVIE